MILKDLNDSIDYIDQNLTKDLNLYDIAKFVGLPSNIIDIYLYFLLALVYLSI